jgi:mannose/fructose/N-acetylgalactosamine-specific phosphotransferase system component IIC
MFTANAPLGDVGHAIQLALAPVFLLTGIAGILNVMTGRLARVIDRGRRMTESPLPLDVDRLQLHQELRNLERRRRLASWAINACTFAALLICMVIATLFAEALLELRLQWLAGLLFTGSTLALVVGLAAFLREVRLATLTVRIPLVLPAPPPADRAD